MNFDLNEDHRMLQDLVARFVREHLVPLENEALSRQAHTGQLSVLPQDRKRLDHLAKELGLWGLDAPEELGGHNLSVSAMVGVNEEFGKTIVPYELAPDSPNLIMLLRAANDAQREKYLGPYARGETQSAIAISEPGAGTDPSALVTKAIRDGEDWVINGRKIWISRAEQADWTIVMAVTEKAKGAKGGISAFIVDKDTPGFVVERRIPMIAGASTYEIRLENVRVSKGQLLGKEGFGFGPMQSRLSSRRVQIAAWNVGRAQRALDLMCDYAPQRTTFGVPLSERQTVQNWIADAAIRIHGCRLMIYEAAARVDRGEEARSQISMIKVASTEMAWNVIDHAMQLFGGMGMTMEMPLQAMSDLARLGRIYEGPNEIHRWIIARELLGLKR